MNEQLAPEFSFRPTHRPQRHRRRNILSAAALMGVSATLLKPESAFASPNSRPNDPPPAPQESEVYDRLPFLGIVEVFHDPSTQTGGFNWDLNQDALQEALAIIAKNREPISGTYSSRKAYLEIILGISRSESGLSTIHFPIGTNRFTIDARTKPLAPDEIAQINGVTVSWLDGNRDLASFFDHEGKALDYVKDFRNI